MNLFYLDEDLDKNAEYHMDTHVVKMPTEAAQMLATAIWVDKYLGFVPRALTAEERKLIKDLADKEPPINERTFTRFLPGYINHPCSIWVRSSLDNFEWTFGYCHALNSEWQFRWRHSDNHKSFEATIALPEPISLQRVGLTERPQCMPEEYKDENPVEAYRMYYMYDKAPFAVWKRRFKPPWWNEYFAEYGGRDPHEAYLNTVKAPTNKGKPHSRDYEHLEGKQFY